MLIPDNGFPTSPGEFLKHEFLEPWGVTQVAFARHVGWTTARLSELIQGKRAVTVETALVLEDATGMPADFWLNAQRGLDLARAKQTHRPVPPLPQSQRASA
jgi:addiction module HigA family antidote